MTELIILGIILVVLYVGLVLRDRNTKKSVLNDQELKDAEHANDILTKSVTRKPERVRKLDKAGYRD